MNFNLADLNWLAILASIVSNMIIGALWYSPLLFGNTWLKLIGKKMEDISKEDSSKAMSLSIIPALVSILFLAVIVKLTGASTLLDALIVGCITSIGFAGMSSLNQVLFEGRSLKLTILNVGYTFVSFNIATIILTLWR